jgi:hypothetical protein
MHSRPVRWTISSKEEDMIWALIVYALPCGALFER